MQASRPSGYTDELKELPDRYWSTGDLREFMAEASPFIMRYCRRRLSRDDDLIGDFYVHFYERAPGCLEHYKSRQNIPFTGFLATYLRHEFLNYARATRSEQVPETPTAEFFGWDAQSRSESDARESRDLEIDQFVAELPVKTRLPLKLYYGMELNIEELREIARLHPRPGDAAEFMSAYRARRMRLSERTRKLEDRSAHLNYLIHRRPGAEAHRRWSRWKHRLNNMLLIKRGVMSIGELANLFGVSKSTIARRMEQAQRTIRGGSES
ncbi:MAG: sigma-70 family RNA polymerase sigma factor [Leptospirales bacterium]|jgi:RNA polymerase sigma factor (sigma-70 family)